MVTLKNVASQRDSTSGYWSNTAARRNEASPPDWLKARQSRPDATDYLIHWTKGSTDGSGNDISAFDALKLIVRCGYLMPSFGPRPGPSAGRQGVVIRGPHPAVCFTEQPLHSFIRCCSTLPSRYPAYGVALRKDRLFVYGGRPVVYGDETILTALSRDWKYLWAPFNPASDSVSCGNPVDWTHEHEWRARAVKYSYASIGASPEEGVPLLLPPQMVMSKPAWHLPWFLVNHREEVGLLRDFIAGLPVYVGTSAVLGLYFENLKRIPVISVDEIEAHLEREDDRWSRLDTLPLEQTGL